MMFGTSFQTEQGNKRALPCCFTCEYNCRKAPNPEECYIACTAKCGTPCYSQLSNGMFIFIFESDLFKYKYIYVWWRKIYGLFKILIWFVAGGQMESRKMKING